MFMWIFIVIVIGYILIASFVRAFKELVEEEKKRKR